MPSAKRKHGIDGADFPHDKNLRTVQEIPLLRTFRGTYPRFVQLGFSLVAMFVTCLLSDFIWAMLTVVSLQAQFWS